VSGFEGANMALTLVTALVVVGLFVYLLAALLRPEWF
jgi:K+-transporting ATPase KdpF subunit